MDHANAAHLLILALKFPAIFQDLVDSSELEQGKASSWIHRGDLPILAYIPLEGHGPSNFVSGLWTFQLL
jgi:hypothetical protein